MPWPPVSLRQAQHSTTPPAPSQRQHRTSHPTPPLPAPILHLPALTHSSPVHPTLQSASGWLISAPSKQTEALLSASISPSSTCCLELSVPSPSSFRRVQGIHQSSPRAASRPLRRQQHATADSTPGAQSERWPVGRLTLAGAALWACLVATASRSCVRACVQLSSERSRPGRRITSRQLP